MISIQLKDLKFDEAQKIQSFQTQNIFIKLKPVTKNEFKDGSVFNMKVFPNSMIKIVQNVINSNKNLMQNTSRRLNQKAIVINQEQVDRFYLQRQQNKRRIPCRVLSSSYVNQTPIDIRQASSKSIYRKKSLMNKLKKDPSLFTSSNVSVSQENTHLLNVNSLKMEQGLNFGRQQKSVRNSQDFNIIFDKQNKIPNKQTEDFQLSSMEDHYLSKRRANSVHLENTCDAINSKHRKNTIPISSILKKYEQEVKRLQTQKKTENTEQIQGQDLSIVSHSDKQSMHKIFGNQPNQRLTLGLKMPIQPKQTLDAYKQNKEQLQNIDYRKDPKVSQRTRNISDHKQGQQQNQRKRLSLLDERLTHLDKQDDEINRQQQVSSQKHHQAQNNQKQTKKSHTIIRQQTYNERIIKQQTDMIKRLTNQNDQYQKFVHSIQKMKATLEKQGGKQKENQSLVTLQKQNGSEQNLKQLWRWIKSLPKQKHDETSKTKIF